MISVPKFYQIKSRSFHHLLNQRLIATKTTTMVILLGRLQMEESTCLMA
jgi:hypothetical protein